MEDLVFSGVEMKLLPGDTLLLYTDGVTEAMNAADELFGDERLLASLSPSLPDAAGVTKAVRSAVADFVREAPQADDITMLVIRYRGSS
jgi:sigma-B regulation protein RsbU (phosphoserine phosphatase)